MYAGGLTSPMQMFFSDLVCQPVVTSYVINAMLHAWTLEYQYMMHVVRLMVDTYEGRKPMASWRRPLSHRRNLRLRNVWLNNVQVKPTLYCYLHCGDLRSPGVTEQRNGPLGLRYEDDEG